MTTWRKLLDVALAKQFEGFDDIVSNTMTAQEMDVEFDEDFGSVEGIPFTVWTTKRVYFPTEYDGAERVASVLRNPDGLPTRHVGG